MVDALATANASALAAERDLVAHTLNSKLLPLHGQLQEQHSLLRVTILLKLRKRELQQQLEVSLQPNVRKLLILLLARREGLLLLIRHDYLRCVIVRAESRAAVAEA